MKTFGNIELGEGSELINAVIATGPAFPDSVSYGELFYLLNNTSADGLYLYDGDGWESIRSISHGGTANAPIKINILPVDDDDLTNKEYVDSTVNAATAGAVAIMQDSQPVTGTPGQLWFNSDTNVLSIFSDNEWHSIGSDDGYF